MKILKVFDDAEADYLLFYSAFPCAPVCQYSKGMSYISKSTKKRRRLENLYVFLLIDLSANDSELIDRKAHRTNLANTRKQISQYRLPHLNGFI